uniref:Uncharacterized protein n=1 Tax=Thermocrinis ruber TaxID=75906 RepID=A0A7C5X3E2_9AQUI
MKGKFGIAALMFSSIALAAPVSTPNNLSDTPIISGGGTVGAGICQAYQTDGTAVNLSGGETLVFYGSGGSAYYNYSWRPPEHFSSGGYLSTKANYSGVAYVKSKMGICDGVGMDAYPCAGGAIGLFAQNTDGKKDFIAGAGAGGTGGHMSSSSIIYDVNAASGGGWTVGGTVYSCTFWGSYELGCGSEIVYSGSVYCNDRAWFNVWSAYYVGTPSAPGFCSSPDEDRGAASSISAWYDSYTKDYTSFATSLTISGGGFYGRFNPILYVCK